MKDMGLKYYVIRKQEKIEMAYYKDEPRVDVSLHGEVFIIDLMTKTGQGQQTGEHIILTRKWLRSSDQPAGYCDCYCN